MVTRFASFVLLCAGISISAPDCRAQDKEVPPQGSAPKPFHSPKTESFVLPNGLRVTIASYGLIPKVNAELVINGGDITEPKEKQGVGKVMGELMKQGTATRSAQDIAGEAASFGGALTIRTGPDQIMVHGEGLSDGSTKLIALLSDVALHPKFPESELPRLKKDQLRLVAIAKSTPRILAAQEFLKTVYGDNGYGRAVPEEAALQSLTIEDVKTYYARHFVPSNARLYVSGVFASSLRQTIEAAFGGWPKGTAPVMPEIKASTQRAMAVVNRPGSQQSTIYMGLPVIKPDNKDYIPLEVADSLLGGSFMSRITSNIREQKGYTYSPRSTIETNAENAIWAEHADVTTKFTGASLTEIFGEIDKLRKQPPPDKELTGIQNGMAGLFILRNSSRQGIIGMLRFVDLHHLPSNYLDTYVSKMYAVKPPEVQGMMEKYIDPAKMTIVVVGDKGQIEPQLTSFKPGQ
jgi:predicted Zn-dependent peptidase